MHAKRVTVTNIPWRHLVCTYFDAALFLSTAAIAGAPIAIDIEKGSGFVGAGVVGDLELEGVVVGGYICGRGIRNNPNGSTHPGQAHPGQVAGIESDGYGECACTSTCQVHGIGRSGDAKSVGRGLGWGRWGGARGPHDALAAASSQEQCQQQHNQIG